MCVNQCSTLAHENVQKTVNRRSQGKKPPKLEKPIQAMDAQCVGFVVSQTCGE